MKFAWTTIRVRDLDRSVKFYNEVLGLPIIERLGSPEHQVVMLGQDGSTRVELIYEPVKLPETLGACVTMGFIPDDFEEYTGRLTALGLELDGPYYGGPVRFSFTHDPDGYRIQFVEFMAAED